MGEQPPLYRICPEAEHSAPGHFCIRKREVLKMSITQKALAEQDYIISLRRDFHAHQYFPLNKKAVLRYNRVERGLFLFFCRTVRIN